MDEWNGWREMERRYGTGILVKRDIASRMQVQFEEIPLTSDGNTASVVILNGSLAIVSVHLETFSKSLKVAQLNSVNNATKGKDNTIVCGDFNVPTSDLKLTLNDGKEWRYSPCHWKPARYQGIEHTVTINVLPQSMLKQVDHVLLRKNAKHPMKVSEVTYAKLPDKGETRRLHDIVPQVEPFQPGDRVEGDYHITPRWHKGRRKWYPGKFLRESHKPKPGF